MAAPQAEQRTKLRAAMFDRSENIVEVVGESHRQDALERLGGGRGPEGVRAAEHVAGLGPEPDNPADPLAIMVQIDAVHIGYLSREDARAYRPVIDRLGRHALAFGCQASLRAGWDRGQRDSGSIGVKLHVGSPAELWVELDDQFGPEAPPASTSVQPPASGYLDDMDRRVDRQVGPLHRAEPVRVPRCSGHSGDAGAARGPERDDRPAKGDHAARYPRRRGRAPRTGKVSKAAEYGIQIVDEASFWSRLGVTFDG